MLKIASYVYQYVLSFRFIFQLLQYAPHITTAMTVTPGVVTVEEMMSVTM